MIGFTKSRAWDGLKKNQTYNGQRPTTGSNLLIQRGHDGSPENRRSALESQKGQCELPSLGGLHCFVHSYSRKGRMVSDCFRSTGDVSDTSRRASQTTVRAFATFVMGRRRRLAPLENVPASTSCSVNRCISLRAAVVVSNWWSFSSVAST